ncbi:MAG TPA: DUF5131 family protein [Opitutaceae bacterium]|nr:DUF5131 family protein [Opitutaceae bacterium]
MERIRALLRETSDPSRYIHGCRLLDATLNWLEPQLVMSRRLEVETELLSLYRCYAGVMSRHLAGKNKGFPDSFDIPKMFPGRTAATAMHGFPRPSEITTKPWLTGLRRLIFVSDMGDALSDSIPFDFLKTEIVDVAASPNGSRHIWLWLTKRAERMAEFSDWLLSGGTMWPKNLVPMASILNPGYARQAMNLLRIPATVRGYSVEPLDNPLRLPDELLGGDGWVILGGESGNGAVDHPFELDWARAIRDQCASSKTPFFMKQLGAVSTNHDEHYVVADSHGGDWREWPSDLRVRQFPRNFALDTSPDLPGL